MTMLAPALARPSAMALPIPLLPPVTIATLPCNVIAFSPRERRYVSTFLRRGYGGEKAKSRGGAARNACRAKNARLGRSGVDDRPRSRKACAMTELWPSLL